MAIRFSYTQEQLDAAVLAERNRCADACVGLHGDMVVAASKGMPTEYIAGYLQACVDCTWLVGLHGVESPK